MRERLTQLFWLALVLVAFCVPLFIGLGNLDLRGDEAGHSFSVDLILETGDWLIPRSSPIPQYVFLEKPPLKFWMTAAGIRAGLPHDEFGLRIWDALFSAIAFLYVFAIGNRLNGPLCGAVALLMLFVNRNLLFEHGLRDNAMEAPLFLAYCGGVFHYMAWATSQTPRSRRLHAIAVAVYFALGFMVKFVAALFLPLVLAVASLHPRYRTRVLREWRTWLIASLVAMALIAPWFIYATSLFGGEFWRTIFGAQVYTRLTSHLDPEHLGPWNHYLVEIYERWYEKSAFGLVAAGAVLFIVDTVRRRWAEGFLVIIWFVVPVTIISLGTSKLFHYAYPFLPPIGLAAGFLIARMWQVVAPLVDRSLPRERGVEQIARWSSKAAGFLRLPMIRAALFGLAAIAVLVFVWTVLVGPFNFNLGGVRIRNTHLLRPALVAILLLILAGQMHLIGRVSIGLLILAMLPIVGYHDTLRALQVKSSVFRQARDCMLTVASSPEMMASGPRGMYIDLDSIDFVTPFNHEFSYYFRSVRPWVRPRDAPPARLFKFLTDPAEQRPLLVSSARYHEILRDFTATYGSHISIPRVRLNEDVMLLLPGPYAKCESSR